MIKIDKELLNATSQKAKASQRKRMNYNFHKKNSDRFQRFLNALEPGTYIRPHKHENPDKTEVFICLRGKILVVEFDDCGEIIDSIILNSESGNYGVEIPPKVWHTIIGLEQSTVAYEIKDGEYNPDDDKNFAPWAPEENSPKADKYIDDILVKLKISDLKK